MTTINRPVLPMTGGCPCAAVRWEVTAMPLFVYACHCTDCQRWSGSAFTMSMPVKAASFRITFGAPKAWHRVGASGVRSTYWFCDVCGGRVYGQREDLPDSVSLRAGALDDTTWLRPVAHVFVRSAQPWENFADQDECYETRPADFGILAERWRQLMNETLR